MNEDREFQKISLSGWLTGCMCWETKSGFLLIILSGLLLWFTDWTLPGTFVKIGYAVLILGTIIQAAGLGRDCKIVYKRRKTR